jgi:hypothetical protein
MTVAPKAAVSGMSRTTRRMAGSVRDEPGAQPAASPKRRAIPAAKIQRRLHAYLRCIRRGFDSVDSTSARRFRST